MKVNLITLGCKVNQVESETLHRKLEERGFIMTEEDADVTILNSCVVTAQSEKKANRILRRALEESQHVIAMGCFVPPQDLLEKVHIIDNADKDRAAQIITDITGYRGEGIFSDFTQNTRAFLKIQDGCNQFCSYCIIPYMRGRERSLSLDKILEDVRFALAQGQVEMVLTGIHLSGYGRDNESSLIEVIEAVDAVEGVQRIRLGSLEQGVVTEEFLERSTVLKHFCDHFHLSLQSGSRSVLKRMNRHYTPEEYLETVERIRRFYPRAAITTDIIVGFPGETEEEFLETMEFVKLVGFSKVHLFSYSKRIGTKASLLKDLPMSVKKERLNRLKEVTEDLEIQYLESFLGEVEEVLYEENYGHTRKYLQVHSEKSFQKGILIPMKLVKRVGFALLGEEL